MKTIEIPEIEKKKVTEDDITPDLYLFVCTGNTCRSPMACALFNYFYSPSMNASSCGVSACNSPISSNAKAALKNRGVPEKFYENHISRRPSQELMDAAKQVICMTGEHSFSLISLFPEYAGKIFVMPHDISDPFGGDIKEYESCLSEIEAGITEIFGKPKELK